MKKLHNTGNGLQGKLPFRRTCPLAIFLEKVELLLRKTCLLATFLEKKLNFYSEEVAQGQQIWPLQHPPTAAMEVTEKNENQVISSKTQKWKVILETKISDQLKKAVSNFHKQDLLFRCCSWVYSLMCKSDDMDAEVFLRRTFSNREVEGICGLTCDNKLADPSSTSDD